MTAATATREPSANGTEMQAESLPPAMPALPAAGPQEPKELDWLDIPDRPGMQVKAWINIPRQTLTKLETLGNKGDTDGIFALLGRIVLEHNGWRDPDGEPYPPADSPEFWTSISNDLAMRTMAAVVERSQQHPNFQPPTRRR